MADAMVTARMSQEKKEAGNRVLEQLGTNASQAVNRLYDYVLEKRQLPFPEERERRNTRNRRLRGRWRGWTAFRSREPRGVSPI